LLFSFFASRLVTAGVDLPTVQELMGHKTIAMTIRYSHLAPSHQKGAIERLVSPVAQANTKIQTDTSGLERISERGMETTQVH
jgi:site-specific recombinase XerC